MPPKRKALDADVDDQPIAKKADKAPKEPLTPLDPSVPTNITLPQSISFDAKPEGCVRIASWNICGTKACDKKGLKFYLEAEDADVICLTETKVQSDPDIAYINNRYKYRAWGADPKKGYAGVAILSKIKPINVVLGLPTWPDPAETHGRMITFEFENHFVVGTYVPNAGEKLKNIETKKTWNEAFEKHLRVLDKQKPVIWIGDQNCALTDKDIRHAKTNWNKTPGYTQIEKDGLEAQINPPAESGHGRLVDIWRERNPDKVGHYTYYSYKFKCREKGIGWRLDLALLSERISKNVEAVEIRQSVYGASDHVPIMLDYKGEL